MPPPANSCSPFRFSSKLTLAPTLIRIGINYGMDCRLPKVQRIDLQLAVGAVWAEQSPLTITSCLPQPDHSCGRISSRQYRDSYLSTAGSACPKPRLSPPAVIQEPRNNRC